jgi:hypothetical protein
LRDIKELVRAPTWNASWQLHAIHRIVWEWPKIQYQDAQCTVSIFPDGVPDATTVFGTVPCKQGVWLWDYPHIRPTSLKRFRVRLEIHTKEHPDTTWVTYSDMFKLIR